MYLRAKSEGDRDTWMEKLRGVMPKNVIPPFKGELEKQVRSAPSASTWRSARR